MQGSVKCGQKRGRRVRHSARGARTVDSAVRLDGVQQKGHDQPRALVVHANTMLRALAGKEDWKRVHGRMACKAAGSQVPPPTAWHEPECGSYYPHLSTHPFHEPGDAWYSERVAAAVALAALSSSVAVGTYSSPPPPPPPPSPPPAVQLQAWRT